MVPGHPTDDLFPIDTDRDRGILTEADREYLLGESDIEPFSQAERRARARIRTRVRDAILDFTYLLECMEPRDRQQIFHRGGGSPDEFHTLHRGLRAMIGFVRLGCDDMEFSFPRLITEGIEDAALQEQVTLRNLEVKINKEVGESFEGLGDRDDESPVDLEGCSQVELQQLHRAGVISTEEYLEARDR